MGKATNRRNKIWIYGTITSAGEVKGYEELGYFNLGSCLTVRGGGGGARFQALAKERGNVLP